MAQATLRSARIQLVPLSDDHLGYQIELDADPEVMRYLGDVRARSREEMAGIHRQRMAAATHVPGLGFWAGFVEGAFVGLWMLEPPRRADQGPVTGQAELGYRLLRRHWRQGLASEGARELIRHGFEDLGLTRIFAETMAVNTASWATMTAVGMRHVRTFHLDWDDPLPGNDAGEVEYELTRQSWQPLRQAAEGRSTSKARCGNLEQMTVEPGSVGPVPERLQLDVGQVRRLIAAQFPQWAELPVRPVATEGWDNRTFHLGADMSVRLPSAAPYALAVEKEHRWLPVLASRLPLPIPVPLAKGEPGHGYPHSWSVYRWIDGAAAARDAGHDLTTFATTLADFLVALRQVDPTGGPPAGLHNWFRGGPLLTYDPETRRAIDALGGRIPADTVDEIWQSALREPWAGRPVWFHGDVAAGNLLVKDGKLVAVIDFGGCGIGDPACDLAIAWTMLSGASRAAFRARLSVDSATWDRGRGWALWKALITYARTVDTDAVEAAAAKYVLDQILAEYAQ